MGNLGSRPSSCTCRSGRGSTRSCRFQSEWAWPPAEAGPSYSCACALQERGDSGLLLPLREALWEARGARAGAVAAGERGRLPPASLGLSRGSRGPGKSWGAGLGGWAPDPLGGGREVRSPARGAGAEGAGPLGGRLRAGGRLAASWLGPGRASLWTLRCFWRSCDTALAPELLFLRSGVIVPAGPVPQGAAPGSAPASPRLLGWRRRNVGRRLHPKYGAPQTGPE